MRSLLVMAWRNLWRSSRRTLINLSAAGLGLFLVVVYTGLVDGIIGDARNQLDNTGMGHVEITAPGWRARHNVSDAMKDPKAILAKLQLPAGSQVGARVVARGLASSAHGSQGVTVHGIDPAAEAQLANYVEDVKVGERLAPDDPRGVLIGERLAERLKVKVGQKVRLMVQRADGEMGADVYRVRGIFHAVAAQASRGLVLVSAGAAQTLLGLPDSAHQVVIQLEHSEDADHVAGALRAQLGPGYEVATFGQLLPVLKAMEGMIGSMMLVMAGFVYLLVGLGILNTTLMSVLERTREFGVMLALGNRPRQIVMLVLAEAFWVATLAVALGLSLGLLVTWVGSEHTLIDLSRKMGESIEYGGTVLKSTLRTQFSVLSGLKAASVVYLLTLAVGLYPAWRISHLHPAEALRHS